jgi:hypothetical protein
MDGPFGPVCRRKRLKTDADFERTLKEADHRCICERKKYGTVRGTEGTGEFALYTPANYVEAARHLLGVIDLDLASNEVAQRTVKATGTIRPDLERNEIGEE